MTSELINKISDKSKLFLFHASKDYKGQGQARVPYEELIVYDKNYPEFIFLVHKTMIFDKGSISDSSYDVYCFDKEGNYVGEEDVKELGRDFFRNMQVIKKL